MEKFRKGDAVVVIAGRDKGKRGAIIRRLDGEMLLVEGVNRVKKHVRPNPMKGDQGGIVEKEMPIHQSNIAHFNSATQRADRVGVRVLDDGRKVRVFKSNGEQIEA
jgi:large subunit ribosomal protein L24